MNCLQLKGKYTIAKKNKQFVTNNKLTIFGAIQLARVLKKDIVYPKYDSNMFGKIISYNGQLKKIKIKEGSSLDFPLNTSEYAKVSTVGNFSTRQYAIDSNHSSYTQIVCTEESKKGFFDVVLKQPTNISRIGILAKYNIQNKETYDSSYARDLSFYFNPQGFNLSYEVDKQQAPTIQQFAFSKGDYIRVYNPKYPTINGKPYYIKNLYLQTSKEYISHCLYFNSEKGKWVIGEIQYKKENGHIWEYFSVKQIKNIIIQFGSNLQKTNTIVCTRQFGQGITYEANYTFTLTQGVNKWIKPTNRLYNYIANFFQKGSDGKYNQIVQQDRYMTLLSDTCAKYDRNCSGLSKEINYSYYSDEFDSMLAYNCYSFQDLQSFEQLYNFQNVDEITPDDQNICGFVPYVKKIRFFITNANKEKYNSNLNIYSIDIFSPCRSPYSPCKIAISNNENFYNAKTFFVDDISIKGKNTVVFVKNLQYNQCVGQNFKYIGLFCNFNGHINGTSPFDVEIKKQNCFSKAQFQIPWSKTEQQQTMITYQLTIGDSFQ